MKRAAYLITMLALVVTSCGLKVPTTIVAGEQFTGDVEADAAITGDIADLGEDAPGELDETIDDVRPNPGESEIGTPVGPKSGLFANETEGVTNNKITICTHVPITGAAPIPHHPDRFGQFYFNYVNEMGGIYGRKVEFVAINDNYNPAGARDAVEKCRNRGAFFYVGAAGTDQIVSVARWAEQNRLPYLHGPTSDKDLKGLKYNVHIGPTYEYQHKLLAQFLFKKFGAGVNYGVIRVNSPYFDAGSQAFVAEIERLGGRVAVNIPVQKDESQFLNVYTQLQRENVQVINNFTTPTIWLTMLNQKPQTYDPTWSAVSPVAGFNIVAGALAAADARAFVFHHFNPACECTTYARSEISQHKDLPWYNDIVAFLDIFDKYSPEKDPPPDDFDYASYLGAKALHRLLLKIGENPTRSKLWALFDSYKEKPADTFPACAADFTRSNERKGAWQVNIFEFKRGVWSQDHPGHTCVDAV